MADTTQHPTIEELRALDLFEGETEEAIDWIAGHMRVKVFDTGEEIIRLGEPADEFIVILDGEMHLRRSDAEQLFIAPKGHATGVLPFSRMKTWGARGWAAQPTRLAGMHISHLRELVYRAPTLAQKLVSEMTDRTRAFTRIEEGANRLQALGKLSAGLAHELNNPASAAVRSSARLREVLNERRRHVLAMRGEVLSNDVQRLMTDLGDAVAGCSSAPGDLDALERADREADLADWLDEHGIPNELASGLVDARITIDQLEPLIPLISNELATHGLHVLVADHEIYCLTREMEEASRRISDLIQAVKSYSYMDQSPVAEVDIEQGIDVTLRMFQHQLKKGVRVSRNFAGNLPRVRANGSELNQIWTNLIDNSLDAMEGMPAGEEKVLHLRTCAEPGAILVEIGDNGPGIPQDVQGRIFEPFFTTKAVGEGTGLGLDIVQRIVRNHKGVIRVESKPGRTVFQVRFPR